MQPCFTPEWMDILTAQGRGRWLLDLSLNRRETSRFVCAARRHLTPVLNLRYSYV